jgi:hypothetical protein
MGAPKGNSFWKSRSKHGRDALFSTPEQLLQAASDYFDYCDSNPWIERKEVVTDKGIVVTETPTQKPYSLSGFRHFVGASESWLREFKKACSIDFLRVIEEIEQFIATQQWEGASVGAFNANIIARTLGLADNQKTDITSNGKDINQPALKPEQIDKLIEKL